MVFTDSSRLLISLLLRYVVLHFDEEVSRHSAAIVMWILWYTADQLCIPSVVAIRHGCAVHDTSSHTRFATGTYNGSRLKLENMHHQ